MTRVMQAAKEYVEGLTQFGPMDPVAEGFIEGAEWQEKQHAEVCGNEFNHVVILKEKLKIATDALGFYADRNNFQLIFDNEEDSKAEVYEKYKKDSIGDFSVKAIEALNELNKP